MAGVKYAVPASVVAATGGLLFGYEISVSGGVASMGSFLKPFFPGVYYGAECSYGLAAFTSSIYLAGLFATFAASYTTRIWGSKRAIVIGALAFFIGASHIVTSSNLAMLIAGRILSGVGVGFGNQAVPLYLSEIARGGLNLLFQLATSIGILTANFVNCKTQHLLGTWGWRVSLVLPAVPATLMTLGACFLPETPNSLIECGLLEEGKAVLQKIRGTVKFEEYKDMVEASSTAEADRNSYRNLLQPRSRPQLAMALLAGINSNLFYAPVLFQSLGCGANAWLILSVFTGVCMVLATILSIDRWGWRKLLGMLAPQIATAITLAVMYQGQATLSKSTSWLVVSFICIFVLGFGSSWGRLFIPRENVPLEIRSIGQSITVAVNLVFMFIITQLAGCSSTASTFTPPSTSTPVV